MSAWLSEQGLDLGDVVAKARESIATHRRDNMALGLSILDLGVINSEHFPFNLTRYILAAASQRQGAQPCHCIIMS